MTDADAAAAIERIRSRRTRIDDPHHWRLSDSVVDTLVYLQRYSSGVPAWVAEADLEDAITLRLRLWWIGEQAECWVLESAHRRRVPFQRLGPRLGIRSRQGVHDRLRLVRLKLAMLTGEPSRVPESSNDQRQRVSEADWLDSRRQQVLAVARRALDLRDAGNVEAEEWLDEVARVVADGVVTPGGFQCLHFAMIELGSNGGESEADDPRLPALRKLWSQLYQQFLHAQTSFER